MPAWPAEISARKINRLKRQRGKDIALFGSADLGSTFIRLGLIDEYGIFVTPVVFGGGSPMFKKIEHIMFSAAG